MADIDALFEKLKTEIGRLDEKFLTKWIPADPQTSPDDFEHDIKAYCVLSHAVFEEFVEELSLIGMEVSRNAWLSNQPTRGTFSLLISYGFQLAILEKEEEDQEPLFDQIRKGLDESKSKHSITLSNNHGFSLKYLRKILTPVGIDIPNEVKLLQSLKDLAEARGSFAHSQAQRAHYGKWKQANRPMTPEQAKIAVADCLELCQKLASRLNSMIPPQNAPTPQAPASSSRIRLPG